MARQLDSSTVLGDPSLVPSTHSRQFTTTFRGSSASGLQGWALTLILTDLHSHTHTSNQKE